MESRGAAVGITMGIAIGIDLGTTYSAMSYVGSSGIPEIIRNREGERITPSVVLFDGEDVVVGSLAKRQAAAFPLDVVQFIKRQMGNAHFFVYPESINKQFRPEEISAFIIKYLVHDAEAALSEEVSDVVITVPAYFDEAQRNATRQAGTMAGVNVLGVLNEPTAAAVSYGLLSGFTGNLLVFDLGGGTLDVTVMRAQPGRLEVLATEGDRNLGGYDFDNEIILWVRAQLTGGGGDTEEDTTEGVQLRERAEDAKRRLSSMGSAPIYISNQGGNSKLTLTVNEFESRTRHLLTRCAYLVEAAVEQAGLSYCDLDKVLMVGGSTRMPMVHQMLRSIVRLEPDMSIHPDESVALGAGIVANLRKAEVSGCPPKAHGGTLVRIDDVVSHGLGVIANNADGKPMNSLVILPNSRIPCQVTADHFTTVQDGQTLLKLEVTEGDEDDVDPKYVRTLGSSTLRLRGRPAGSPIRVVFSCDLDGILHVEVIDLVDGAHLGEMEIDRTANLTDSEVAEIARQIDSVRVQ